MIKRLVLNRIKTDLEFPLDVIEDCFSTVFVIITTFSFWSILIEKYNLFGLTKAEIFLFLFYQKFVTLLTRYFFKAFKKVVEEFIKGKIILSMLYPKSIYIFYFLKDLMSLIIMQ